MTHDNAPTGHESGFEVFGLAETILTSIKNEGFSTPTEIQSGAIPALMTGRDLMGIAQTGGGKTAAFVLPVINRLLENYQKPRQNMPKVLVLAPTRELAIQIEQSFVAFSKGTQLRCLVVAGGQPYPPQTTKLRRGVDILVATPGRLIDHIGRKNVKFAETGVFILDEADRMLDMGFIDDVRDLAQSLPDDHQTIMFSATMNPKVRTLSKNLLNNPVRAEIYQKTAVADTITHRLMNVSRKNKAELLVELLAGDGVDKVLIFARTKRGADELSKRLHARGIRSDAIHGDKRQRVREKILMNFRRGRTSVLVATDVAARGIDVDGISHVINYELPIEPENYIHRVGRTGRAGAKGIAISFCDPSDMRLLVHIEKLIKQPIEVDENHDFHIDVARGKASGSKAHSSRGQSSKTRSSRGQSGKPSRNFRGQSDNSDAHSQAHSGKPPRNFRGLSDNPDAHSQAHSGKPSRNFRGQNDNSDAHSQAHSGKPSRNFRGQSDREQNSKERFPRERREQPTTRKQSKPFRQDRSSRKAPERYDPWTAEARKYTDDPVLGKLLGKPAEFNSKKEDKSEFVKTGVKKKSFKKKETNSASRKKVRGGKKILSTGSRKPHNKNSGGNKTFSPRKKTQRSIRAA